MAFVKIKLSAREKQILEKAGVEMHHINEWIKEKEQEFAITFMLYKARYSD